MIPKRISILVLTIVTCFCFLSFGICQQHPSISISSSGTISLIRSYICGNYNSTHYYAENNLTGNYELISTDASQTISYALSKLTPERTWQETVYLKGAFSIITTVTLSQAKVLLDCRQATVTSTTAIPLIVRSSDVTILGGHWVGQVANTRIQFLGAGATRCTIDNFDANNFALEPGYDSTYITVQNCYFYDSTGNYFINFLNSGYNIVRNCHFHNGAVAALFFSAQCHHNQILSSEFDSMHNHDIYLDGGSGSIGTNIIAGCSFHDHLYNAGAQIKCQNNKIYNNTFYNFLPSNTVGLSIYSEYSPSYANDNEVYNNTFTDMTEGIWLGHNPANYPTLRNKIHDNTFTNVTNCIGLNRWSGSTNTTEDTWIYYNHFYSCTSIFPGTGGPTSVIKNTVVAYNTFDTTVLNADVLALKSYVNTLIYGNAPWMVDYPTPLPSPLPIPPP